MSTIKQKYFELLEASEEEKEMAVYDHVRQDELDSTDRQEVEDEI